MSQGQGEGHVWLSFKEGREMPEGGLAGQLKKLFSLPCGSLKQAPSFCALVAKYNNEQ